MTGSGSRSDDRFRLARLSRGLSQGALADIAGVTRQSISGIESGRWSPSLEVALALASALGTSVEDLFGAAPELPVMTARLATPARESARMLVWEIEGSHVALPLLGDAGFVPGFRPAFAHAAHEEAMAAGSLVEIQPFASFGATLAVAGCDPALALLAGPLERHRPAAGFVWWSCANAAGLRLLEAGTVHAAAVHRRADEQPRRVGDHEVVGFAAWREGLVVAPGHAGSVRCLADAIGLGLRLANREPGSEARRLLDDAAARARRRAGGSSPATRAPAAPICSLPPRSPPAWPTSASRASRPPSPTGSGSCPGRRRSASCTSRGRSSVPQRCGPCWTCWREESCPRSSPP